MNEHHWDFSSAAALVSQRSIIDVNELDWKAVSRLKVIELRARDRCFSRTVSGDI